MKNTFIIIYFSLSSLFSSATDICEDMSLSKANQRQLMNTGSLIQAQLGTNRNCNHVPKKDRALVPHKYTSEKELAEISKDSEACISSKVSQLFKIGILNLMKPNWNKFDDPWGTVDTLKEIEKQLLKNSQTSTQISNRIVQTRYGKLSLSTHDFDCYNTAKKSEMICSSFGQRTEIAVEELLGSF